MEKPLDSWSRWKELFSYLSIWWIVTLVFAFGVAPVITKLLGAGAADKLSSDPAFIAQHVWFLRCFESANAISEFILPPFIFCLFYREQPFTFLGIDRVPSFRLLLISALILLFSLPFIFYTFQVNQRIPLPEDMVELEKKIQVASNAMLVMKNPMELIANLLLMALLPAIGEELFFRGGLQRLMAKAIGNGHIAILLTAIFFSFIHFEFSGFIPRLILAIVFGYMYYWSRNLWLTIFVHALFNGFQIALLYFIGADKLDKIQSMDVFPYAAAVVSAMLTFLAMSWLYRRTRGRWLATLEKTDEEIQNF